MEANMKRRKLRSFFISKDLQRPMIVAHLAYILLVALALIVTVLFPFYSDMLETGDLLFKNFSAKMFIVLLERSSIACLIITVISFFHFILLTHKFCGPLVNIGRTIARMSEKDFTRQINLRRGDFLNNEANQVNAMMKSLSDSIEIIKKENHLLLKDIAESIQARGKLTEVDAALKGFHDRAERCQVRLNHFQLIGESMNSTGTGQLQQQHLVGDKSPSVDICA